MVQLALSLPKPGDPAWDVSVNGALSLLVADVNRLAAEGNTYLTAAGLPATLAPINPPLPARGQSIWDPPMNDSLAVIRDAINQLVVASNTLTAALGL